MPTPVILGADDQSVTIKIVDSTDFSPETGVTSASAGLALWYRKGATGAVTALTESDLAAVDSAHSDGGMKHLGDGLYRVDLPDAAIPTIENEVTVVGGAVTGMHVLGAALVGVQPIGAPAGASVSADIAAIEAQTDDIGTAGAGLTAVPWNAAWDAEVQSEAADALVAYGASTYAGGDTPGTTTLLTRITAVIQTKAEADTAHGLLATAAKLLSYFQSALRSDVTVDADIGGTYDDATDSQQAIRDRGDSAWGSAGATGALASGTAQAGSTSTTIKLASGASAVDDLYRYLIVLIDGGTGAGQARMITDYVGSTRVATVDRAWITTPDATSTYRVHHWSDNWAASTRTLTTPGATDADETNVSAISRRRGDRWTIVLTGLGSIADRTKLWFTLKGAYADADADAWLQVTEDDGLIVVYGGGTLTAGNADITVDDEDDGDITITVAGIETAKLLAQTAYFDVQVLRTGANGPDTIATGNLRITVDVTQATS